MSGPRRADLVVIVGPTAAGKTGVAEELARRRSGEIISADAFAVYRGFDVGTAKPTPARRAEVSYHLVDVAEPGESFSAGRWAAMARDAAEEIRARRKLPIVAGGSGFYVSALLDGLPEGDASDPALRRRLARWARRSPEAARRMLEINDPVSAGRIGPSNVRYALRALEIVLLTGAPASVRRPPEPSWRQRWRLVQVGIAPDRATLHARIERRVREMIDAGWDEEVRGLLGSGLSLEASAFSAIGYREVADWVMGGASASETEKKIVAATRQLAKRQRTWFSRDRGLRWLEPDQAIPAILAMLAETGETERNG
ncbi:MAG: tRNA (adenosine(37)-N6)-dimethylallyltransferase MiaA [Thermoanaerobaculia bacterium]